MKKLLTIFLGIALVLPLYSQEADAEFYNDETGNEISADETTGPNEHSQLADEEKPGETAPASKPKKKGADFARKAFELGLGLGVGFDNGLAGLSDVLRKNVIIDLTQIAQGVPENGTGFNFGLGVDVFMSVKNIHIGQGLWNFGLIVDVDGGINLNIPKSLFTLISEGNASQHDSSGTISGSGGVYTEIGLRASAKYPVAGKALYVGIKPAVFTPVAYIPSSPGISYHLYTEKEDGKEGLFLDTGGEIEIYTASSFENPDIASFIIGPSGFDLSLEGQYALFPFLDVGGSFSNIPFAPAKLTNQMTISMKDFNFGLVGEDLLGGGTKDGNDNENGDENSSPEFETLYNDNANKQVIRPFRFDVYARYKPFNTELLALIPNIGFSVNGEAKGYFNAGLEARLNLINLFILSLSSKYQEEIWRQRIGLALNLRAFELDLDAIFRDQTFGGCFQGRGFEFKLGLRFGW